jgi:CBS-domain-containing membrane protein
MDRMHYSPLPQSPLKIGAAFYMPDPTMATRVRIDSPAIEVMTDLRRVGAVTVGADTSIGVAEQAMKIHSVRALIVVDELRRVLGVITANDILGEKPMKLTHERGLRRTEITVQHIMTPAERIDVIAMSDVLHADVGHVLETLQQSARQHALVVDEAADGRSMIRGIFSSTQIARQLGITLHTAEVGRSFAEIEAAIAR